MKLRLLFILPPSSFILRLSPFLTVGLLFCNRGAGVACKRRRRRTALKWACAGAFLTFCLLPFAFCLLPLSRVILLVVGEVSRQTAAAPAFSSESERVSDRQTQPSKRPVSQPHAAVDDCRRGLS